MTSRAPAPVVARHVRRFRTHPVLRRTALVATAVLGFTLTSGATAWIRLENNIETHDVTDLLGERPELQVTPDPADPAANRPLNLLILGSDERTGEDAIGGAVEGMRSDTTIVAHISADRSRVELVSIPRDSHVQIPACTRSDGTTSRAQEARFNAAFAIGAQNGEVSDAVACTLRTVESLTGVYIDGWVVVDFVGFIEMVEAIGGVEMCIPERLYSVEASLDLLEGCQTLDGPTALAYARARKGTGLGDGSDLGRVTRQQDLMAAMVAKVLDSNLLTDSAGLYRFVSSATRSLTTDPETGNIGSIVGLGFSLRGLSGDDLTFMTIPVAAYAPDPNQVVWTAEADEVWQNIARDLPVTDPAAGAAPEATTGGGDG